MHPKTTFVNVHKNKETDKSLKKIPVQLRIGQAIQLTGFNQNKSMISYLFTFRQR